MRNYACVFDRYLEKFEALRNAVRGLRMLRIFSTFLKILNFLKLRFGASVRILTLWQSRFLQNMVKRFEMELFLAVFPPALKYYHRSILAERRKGA